MSKHKAYIKDEWLADGVSIALARDLGGARRVVYDFRGVAEQVYDPVEPPEIEAAPLLISTEAARALYEALAEHFGHAGHDARALRRDYEAERRRVDRFIEHLTPQGRERLS